MNTKFSELPWHDAELLGVIIDRSSPGENDQVVINVRWPNGEQDSLIFSDCYALEAKMNFGVIAPESILNASLVDQSKELTEIRGKWARTGIDLQKLKCFEIETNSTASLLRIYSMHVTGSTIRF